ncbi:MAG: hypothetical protein GX159_03775 [Flavobacteriaceae bacterium]|nr:hypothetical protein [Flavobacteriaceae bacterium]
MWLQTTGDANDNDIDMDNLTYTYQNGNGLSNLLVNVADAVTTGSNEGFKDGNTDPNLDDYEYDANGNMIKDRNKGISNITYNYLNLPTQIEFEGTNDKITYLYSESFRDRGSEIPRDTIARERGGKLLRSRGNLL